VYCSRLMIVGANIAHVGCHGKVSKLFPIRNPCELRVLCRRSYFGPRTCGGGITNVIEVIRVLNPGCPFSPLNVHSVTQNVLAVLRVNIMKQIIVNIVLRENFQIRRPLLFAQLVPQANIKRRIRLHQHARVVRRANTMNFRIPPKLLIVLIVRLVRIRQL
jgi:hypothetical protein